MKTMLVHKADYNCGKRRTRAGGPSDTIDATKVTCPACKAHIRRTGDGPESLKALLRFRFP